MPLQDTLKNIGQTVVSAAKSLLPSSGGSGDTGTDPVINVNEHMDGNSYPLNRQSKSALKEILKGDTIGFAIDLFNSKKILPFHFYQESDLNQDDRRFKNTPEVHQMMKSIQNLYNTTNIKLLVNNLEDPLIVGFDMTINEGSVLFGYGLKAVEPSLTSDLNSTESNNKNAASSINSYAQLQRSDTGNPLNSDLNSSETRTTNISNDSINDPLQTFISNYRSKYPEMGVVANYVERFRTEIIQLFKSTKADDFITTNNIKTPRPGIGNKFHYINILGNLKVMDEMFIKPETFENNNVTGKSHITLKLHEDATLFSNNLAFLYRNICYNYKLGKRIIPENLLRFNLTIKFAEMRNFTTTTDSYLRNNGTPSTTANNYADTVRSKFNCFVYELKDCYFIFDETILPDSITQAGFGQTNKSFSELSLKIGFRSVQRSIFPITRYFDNNTDMASTIMTPGFIWDNADDTISASNKYAVLKDLIDGNPLPAYNTSDGYETLKDNIIRTPEKKKAPSAIDNFIDKKLSKVNIGGVNLGAEAKVLSTQVKNAGKDIAREGIKQIKGAAYGVRNELVNTLENKISGITGFGLPRPENVYGFRYQRDEDGNLKLDSDGHQIAEKIKDNSLRGLAEQAVNAIVNGISTGGEDPAAHHPGVESYNIYEDREISPNYVSSTKTNATISPNHSVFQAIQQDGTIGPRLNPADYAKSVGDKSDREITPNYKDGVLNTTTHNLFTDNTFAKRVTPNADREITPNYTNGVINDKTHNLFTDNEFKPRVTPNADREVSINYKNGVIVDPSKHNLFTDNEFNPRVVPNEDVAVTPNYNRGVIVDPATHNLFTDNEFKKRVVPDEDVAITPNYNRGVINDKTHDLYTDNTFKPRSVPDEDVAITPNYNRGVIVTPAQHNLYTDNEFNQRAIPDEDVDVTPNYNRGTIVSPQTHNLYTDNEFKQRSIPDEDVQITPNYNRGVINNQTHDLYTDNIFKSRAVPDEDVQITPNYNRGTLVTPDQHNLFTDNEFKQRSVPDDDREITPNYKRGVINPIQDLYTDNNFNTRSIPDENVNGVIPGAKPTEDLGSVINKTDGLNG